MLKSEDTGRQVEAGAALWIALVTAASVVGSLALACATPFAALATASALTLRRGLALSLVGLTWFLNQAVGYGLLHYPRTQESFAWGAAIGLAAVAATLAVDALRSRKMPTGALWAAGFVLAFVVYEGVLFVATFVLTSGEGAFSPAVVGRILLVNLLALLGLAIARRAALAIRMLPTPAAGRFVGA